MIREARPDDLPALRAIQAVALAEPWPELLAVAVDGPPPLLVDADPNPVGYALAVAGDADGDSDDGSEDDSEAESAADRLSDAATDAELQGSEPSAYLVELAVAEGRRGEGRGSALLSAMADRLRDDGFGRLFVTVRAIDERARSFYADHGFERVARLPDHYDAGDGLLLARPLR